MTEEDEPHLPSEIILATALVFAPFAFGATESWSRAVLFLLTAALALTRWRHLGLSAAAPAPRPPLLWAIAALAALAAAQAANPVSPLALALARWPFTGARAATFEWLFTWSVYGTLLLAAPPMFRSKGAAERLAWLLLVCGATVAAVGLAQQQAGNDYYYGLRKVSSFRVPFGPYPNKNHAAAYLGLALLAGAGLGAVNLERSRALKRAGRPDEFYGRLIIILALEFLVVVGLFSAHSRGAVGALVGAGGMAAALYMLSARGVSRTAALAFFLAGAGLLAGGARTVGVRFSSFLPSAGENSVTFRTAMAADGLKIVSAYPVFGIGLGALGAVYPLWMDPVMKGFYTDHLHCDPVELAAEAGVPLAVTYYGAFLITLAMGARLIRPQRDPPSPLNLALLAGAGALLIHQVLEFPSHIMSLQYTALTCLAAGWGLGVLAPTPPPLPRPPAPPRAALVTACAAILCAALAGPRLAAAYFDLLASRHPQPSKQYYQVQAARLEPTYDRHIGLALSNWQLAVDNTAARVLLLRAALRHSSAALEFEPLRAHGREVHAALLENLGRRAEARDFRRRR